MKHYYKLVNQLKIQQVLTAVFSILFLSMIGIKTNAQFTSTWVLTSDKTSALAGTQAALVTAGDMAPGIGFEIPGSHNTDGYRCQITTGPWISTPTNGYHVDFPLSPIGGYDLTITGLLCGWLKLLS